MITIARAHVHPIPWKMHHHHHRWPSQTSLKEIPHRDFEYFADKIASAWTCVYESVYKYKFASFETYTITRKEEWRIGIYKRRASHNVLARPAISSSTIAAYLNFSSFFSHKARRESEKRDITSARQRHDKCFENLRPYILSLGLGSAKRIMAKVGACQRKRTGITYDQVSYMYVSVGVSVYTWRKKKKRKNNHIEDPYSALRLIAAFSNFPPGAFVCVSLFLISLSLAF